MALVPKSGPLVPGEKFDLRGLEVVVTPLLLVDYFELQPRIEPLREGKASEREQFEVSRDVIFAALRGGNYPELTQEDLVPRLDMANTKVLVRLVLALTALGKPAGEAGAP